MNERIIIKIKIKHIINIYKNDHHPLSFQQYQITKCIIYAKMNLLKSETAVVQQHWVLG